MSDMGIPPSLFFFEFLTVVSVYFGFALGIVALRFDLFLSFYYSIYVISCSLMGCFFCIEIFGLGLFGPFLFAV